MIDEHAPAQLRKEVAVAWRQNYRPQLEERMRWWYAASIILMIIADGALVIIIIGLTLHLPLFPSSASSIGRSFIYVGSVLFGCAAAALSLTALSCILYKRRLMRQDAPPVTINERNCATCAFAPDHRGNEH